MKRLIEQAKQGAIALEQLLDAGVNTLMRPAARALEPLETRNAILLDIERAVIPGPHGTRLFPYNDVTVELVKGTVAQNAALEATLDGDGGLEKAVRQRLAQSRCDPPRDFTFRVVRLAFVPHDWPADQLHRVRFDRVAPPLRSTDEMPATTLLLALKPAGEAEARTYRMTHGRLDIGRVAEVLDPEGRLVRRNAVVIADVNDPNGTVSRRHAHIKATPDPEGGRVFAVYDDGSRYGTRIVRDGETITVHSSTRGVRLRDGDEIHLGDVSAMIRLESL